MRCASAQAWARAHTASVDPFQELPGKPGVPDDLTHLIRRCGATGDVNAWSVASCRTGRFTDL